ncbi:MULTISPECIES: peptidoglycan-associated lipoprotein Pal [unclassified Undibacterium]|uniref:peptidoglycan-associated lipoprotein Pal n=1 Tax=unclassified Undibacterium TaxID=2630295 RepID=UPI002AC8C4DC|nr:MULTISPECIES: peptidoglycan-associated lipoprotein Pal [unclassified Undibacterium]MEB0140032.1 peptidoglycan-associated lipoprotein Pal [Undibacterium sp. CCC2.1]MEB0173055.1 peptidoglycan-associated lipoprotein Pal [Undibacterium sp. CCC1.1]MEB0176867.1 peptidoglycan-associated lipoprotein Pal [Undibacterium sp. CCC3.4]MEB0216099.1 peptidoglycan-associated lipoprotein Pal [Undibacterium sp. 5I2]WPX42018.1 peptidoglycan-associated lipoprotein Pal [Undibacterium sp. CCC3.4]
MRFTSQSKTLALLASSVVLMAACTSNVPLEAKAKIEDKPIATTTPPPADPNAIRTVDTGSTDPLNDPQGVLAKRSVYFDYDSYAVKDDYKGVVEAHSKYLSSNKARTILIQGNTDERGGSEYNLALGQKRAEAVRKSMSLLGVPEAQLEAVSLGKEKPKASGHDEASWAENRRADIVYK